MSDSRKDHYEPWIGVDLDGTLAHVDDNRDYESDHIGEPIEPMIDRVRKWCQDGKTVKIFTARADDEKAVTAIKKWLRKHDLPDLDVTNLKDPGMTEFWDDKAVAVEKNTGKVAESIVDILLEAGTWTEYWVSPNAELIQAVPGHVYWAIKNVLRQDEWRKDQDGTIVGAYDSMFRRGWRRVVIEHGRIWVDAYRLTRDQMAELELVALDRRLIITDDKSNRDVFNPSHDS